VRDKAAQEERTKPEVNRRMKNNRIIYIGAAILGLSLIAVLAPNAVPATTATLTASVVDQVCQGGDRVMSR